MPRPDSRRKPRGWWTAERIEELRQLVGRGKDTPEVARHFDTTPDAVRAQMANNGIVAPGRRKSRRRPPSQETTEAARRSRESRRMSKMNTCFRAGCFGKCHVGKIQCPPCEWDANRRFQAAHPSAIRSTEEPRPAALWTNG